MLRLGGGSDCTEVQGQRRSPVVIAVTDASKLQFEIVVPTTYANDSLRVTARCHFASASTAGPSKSAIIMDPDRAQSGAVKVTCTPVLPAGVEVQCRSWMVSTEFGLHCAFGRGAAATLGIDTGTSSRVNESQSVAVNERNAVVPENQAVSALNATTEEQSRNLAADQSWLVCEWVAQRTVLGVVCTGNATSTTMTSTANNAPLVSHVSATAANATFDCLHIATIIDDATLAEFCVDHEDMAVAGLACVATTDNETQAFGTVCGLPAETFPHHALCIDDHWDEDVDCQCKNASSSSSSWWHQGDVRSASGDRPQ